MNKYIPKKKIINITLLILSCILLVLGIYQFYSHSMIYPKIFDSDSLFFPSLYKDLFKDGFDWYGWSFPAAPNYFPDILLYFVIEFFTGFFTNNFVYSMLIYLIIKQVIILLGFIYLLKIIIPDVYLDFRSLIILMGAFVLILIGNININGLWLLQSYLTRLQAHSGAFIVSLFSLILVLQLLKQEKNFYYFILFILSSFTSLSDRIFYIYFIFPICLTIVIFYIFNFINFRLCIKVISILIIASFVGHLLHQYITIYPILQHYFIFSIKRFTKSLASFLRDIMFLIHKKDIVISLVFLWLLTTVLLIPLIIITHTKNLSTFKYVFNVQNESTQNFLFFIVYLIIMNFIVIISPIVMGVYIDLTTMRYFFATVCFSLFGWIFLIGFFMQFLRDKWRKIFVFFSILFITFLLIKYWQKPSNVSIIKYRPKITKCLDTYAPKYKLSFGISDYWNAKLNTMFSKKGLRVYQVDNNLQPYHVINNIEWYNGKPSSHYPNPQYNFVILGGKGGFDIKKKKVIEKFGPPAASFKCAGTEVLVYNRKKDLKFRNQFRYNLIIFKELSRYKLRYKGGTVTFPAASLFSNVGQVIGGDRIARGGKDKPGWLIYGPYLPLKKGRYKLTLIYYIYSSKENSKIAKWDIHFYKYKILKSGFIISTKNKAKKRQLKVYITINRKLENIPLEFRVFYLGTGYINVKELQISRIY